MSDIVRMAVIDSYKAAIKGAADFCIRRGGDPADVLVAAVEVVGEMIYESDLSPEDKRGTVEDMTEHMLSIVFPINGSGEDAPT